MQHSACDILSPTPVAPHELPLCASGQGPQTAANGGATLCVPASDPPPEGAGAVCVSDPRKELIKLLAVAVSAKANAGTLLPDDPDYAEMMRLARELSHEAGIACDCAECFARAEVTI